MADDIATVCDFSVALPSLEDMPSACIANVGASTAHHSMKELAVIRCGTHSRLCRSAQNTQCYLNAVLKTGQSVSQLQDEAAKTLFLNHRDPEHRHLPENAASDR
ncbi:hypothetical protein HPB49_015491 [Dermacentor silvarum]|uniref:Uncharacterized protein n=1 Tax=Dermacentor silvarum TaxID=543639 RepID=A0ACB8DPW6_DERSI|nr:hypothetical protein HPB49_015491 [Dermacentor silvarum]